jgi:8-oxo-dGTP pyrophosphatase MutT (NUDIX family)
MTDIAERLTRVERDQTSPNLRPRDAATLILIDRSGAVPKVLMGRRHHGHKFMPGKFVFPGGRVESYDGRMPAAGQLAPEHEARLLRSVQRGSAAKARAFALAAIRETCEETGLLLGNKVETTPKVPSPSWQMFADANVVPDLAPLQFIARAITPPRRSRRFDARFFAADAQAIAHRMEGIVGPQAELDEIVWIPITEARSLDLPTITQVVLDELQQRVANGYSPAQPVPFYRMLHKRFVRELLE